MRGTNIMVINGKVYDAVTGLPVAAPDPVSPVVATAAPVVETPRHSVAKTAATPVRHLNHAAKNHVVAKKSSTLRRDVLKKPASAVNVGVARRKPAVGHVQKSAHIHKFAPHPQPLVHSSVKPNTGRSLDIAPAKPATHSIVASKHALVAKNQASAQPALSSRVLKEQLIAERLAQVDTTSSNTNKTPGQKNGLFSKKPRFASFVAVSFAVMIFGGYLTYLNMPGLSVRVAAAQADVAASFPDYHPDGYRFDGPVSYSPGQVAINFQANGGNAKYTVTEQKSTWDSQAVYDNLVARVADDSYITNSQQGLTIYTYKGKAAWVNKGILYTVGGDAPLSNEQLLKIAASL